MTFISITNCLLTSQIFICPQRPQIVEQMNLKEGKWANNLASIDYRQTMPHIQAQLYQNEPSLAEC